MSDPKVSLEPTAALVMDLAKKLYTRDKAVQEYYSHLDLSSGDVLIDAYKKAGIYELTSEQMCNRKYTINHILGELLTQAKEKMQIVILAAGKSPLSLQLLNQHAHAIEKIFEVDISSFNEKKLLYYQVVDGLMSKLEFIETDIAAPDLTEQLKKQSYNPARGTIIVLEGITHYLTAAEVQAILKHFSSGTHRRNATVIEYGPPFETMTERLKPVAERAYPIIEETCYFKPMTKFSIADIKSLFVTLGGALVKYYPMNEMEQLRTGKNEYFPEPDSGWVEVAWGTL